MNLLLILNSPVFIISAFLFTVCAVYVSAQSFIKFELEGNDTPGLHAFTAILCSVSFLGALVILGIIIGHFA